MANLNPSGGASRETQRKQLDLLARFNSRHLEALPPNSELAARIEAYELAYRMQAHAPAVIATSGASESTKKLYHSNWDTHGDNDKRHRKLCTETDKPIAGLLADLKQRGLLDETLIVWAGEFGRTLVGTGGRDHRLTDVSGTVLHNIIARLMNGES